MANTPKVQTDADLPKPGAPIDDDFDGIPPGADQAEPKGRPSSDRLKTETTPERVEDTNKPGSA